MHCTLQRPSDITDVIATSVNEDVHSILVNANKLRHCDVWLIWMITL